MNQIESPNLIISVLEELSTSYEAADNSCFKTVEGEVWTRILFLSGDTDIFVKAWCVGGLNTDCTDCTDSFWEDVEYESPVVRSVFEHGFHGLHGFFLETWLFRWVPVMRRGVLNTDCTDYTDVFIGGRQDWRLWSHCEEAQDYPWNPCYPCSIKKTSVVTHKTAHPTN